MKIILSICVILLFCCTIQSHNGIVTTPYDRDRVKKQTFNENGQLMKEQIFKKKDSGLIEDGYIKIFKKDGRLKVLGFYKNGKKDSSIYVYNEYDKLVSKLYMLDDSLCGSQYYYYGDGKINYYLFHTNPSEPRFALYFDSLGNVVKKIGIPSEILILNKKTFYSPKDTVQINYLIPTPENIRTVVYVHVKIKQETGNWVRFNATDFVPMHIANIFCVREPPYSCGQGSAEFTTVVNMYDSISNKLIVSDTERYSIHVKN